jgi:hypothetical protein
VPTVRVCERERERESRVREREMEGFERQGRVSERACVRGGPNSLSAVCCLRCCKYCMRKYMFSCTCIQVWFSCICLCTSCSCHYLYVDDAATRTGLVLLNQTDRALMGMYLYWLLEEGCEVQ